VACAVAVLLLAVAATAYAAWGPHGECSERAEPNRHCYVLAAKVAPAEKVDDFIFTVGTQYVHVPQAMWQYENFITQEGWLSYEYPGWIEAGNITGEAPGGEDVHPFVTEVSPNGVWHQYVSPGVIWRFGQQTGPVTYAIFDPGHNGVWHVYWGCCGDITHYGGGIPPYASELEAGTEVSTVGLAQSLGKVWVEQHLAGSGPTTRWPRVTAMTRQADFCTTPLEAPGDFAWGNQEPNNCHDGVLVTEHGGPAGAAAVEGEVGPRITNYARPSGSELDMRTVAEIAASHAGGCTGCAGTALKAQIAKGTFAGAKAITDGSKVSEAESGSDEELAELDSSTAYLVMLKRAKGKPFTPSLPTRAGHPGPKGKVLAYIIDAHTGFVEGTYVGDKAPKIKELGPVTKEKVG
jgi:hypothetical protein